MIYVVDEVMGRGKTSAMINFVNDPENDGPFLFVVPYLTEITRIMDACSSRGFVTPERDNLKLVDLKTYMSEGLNVVCTHALFGMFDEDLIRFAKEKGYVMIMDEVPSVISPIHISKSDAEMLLDNYVRIGKRDVLEWIDPDYQGAFDDYKRSIECGSVVHFGSACWVNVTSPRVFSSFRDVYLMTYMFKDSVQRCYFDLYGIRHKRLYICGLTPETYRLSEEPGEQYEYDYRELIHILDNDKLNSIGNDYNALSKGWYRRHKNDECIRLLRKNMYNFFRNYAHTPSRENLWTTFCRDRDTDVDWEKLLADNGYRKGFLSCNARGTNEFRDRTALAYVVNRFPTTPVYSYFHSRGLDLDRDMFALSEMLQWIWRSAIRDGKPIQVYVPSSRMRNLLKQWIEDTCKGVRY